MIKLCLHNAILGLWLCTMYIMIAPVVSAMIDSPEALATTHKMNGFPPSLDSPIIFKGGAKVAYRDPAAVYVDGVFRLFFTLVETEADGRIFMYTAWSKSTDLRTWSQPVKFTPRNQSLDFSSPGDIVRYNDEWVLCLQTYPRPSGERLGNADARIWTMRSKDLENWGPPELLQVKGPSVLQKNMGRMIDGYILHDKDNSTKFWAFFKQNGVSRSWSTDLQTWTFVGHTPAGENVCIIVDSGEYLMFHSPANGVGMKRSLDLQNWTDLGTLKLGQATWPWASGRLTAAFVLDLRSDQEIGKVLMFFHGSAYPEGDPRGGFDTFASLGLAWSDSDDLMQWSWPGKNTTFRTFRSPV